MVVVTLLITISEAHRLRQGTEKQSKDKSEKANESTEMAMTAFTDAVQPSVEPSSHMKVHLSPGEKKHSSSSHQSPPIDQDQLYYGSDDGEEETLASQPC